MTEWNRSFQMGLALGLTGKPLPFKREPVAFLYNGVKLPALPEWDREMYPFAVIGWDNSNGKYWLVCFTEAKMVSPTGTLSASRLTDPSTFLAYTPKDSGWEESSIILVALSETVWANHDVYESTNLSLYLPGSDPIPVYE